MKSLWNDIDAARFHGELGARVYSSRLLGRDKSLVLHGGGNTSVKIRERNLIGEKEEILYVKGSGWDLETIEEAGFSPVRMDHLWMLARLEALSDPQMVNELQTHLTKSSAPIPSVETLLHAILPYKFVDHTHADAVLAITNTTDGEARIREIYDSKVVVIPYVMPGFDLARLCAGKFPTEAGPDTIGMVLMNHGVFSFGGSARESYERMIALVRSAEDYLARHRAWALPQQRRMDVSPPHRADCARLRKEISTVAGAPLILKLHHDARSRAFCAREDLADVAAQGPATPDHAIRTKRIPMIGEDIEGYARQYCEYFERHAPLAREKKTMLDPAPRVVLQRDLGMLTLGRSARDAEIVADLYFHTMDVIERATALGGYRALSSQDIFAVEYWDLEQATLRKGGRPPLFQGEVALVTGAASGIGKACVTSLLARGAAVIALDIEPSVADMHRRADYLGIRCDITAESEVRSALDTGVRTFGGIDILVLNAGVFPGGTAIAQLQGDEWRSVMGINADANVILLRECHPLLKFAPRQGRVVIIGSKNVPAPGPGAAAYSASKAALNQLARVAALEWGADGIRVNVVHPNAVFDTGIWTDDVLASRAAHYGISVDEYKRKNVLRTEVTSHDVAELVAEMCGPLFAKTTGAQLPIDGGNERVI
jgi:rhamnose utilization protein RhaD (predicted bifunctional aldolase and dehydrogenase)/NAD(P)-dependent dehydrogenase (short-subunit alcohol dehydrogenase family)